MVTCLLSVCLYTVLLALRDQDMSCAECFRQHEHTWDLALKHRFLFDCQHATIRRSQFDTWLVQDYLFVREFTRLAAVLLSKAPYSDFDVILGGIVALKSELTWFQVHVLYARSLCWSAQSPYFGLLLLSAGTGCQA